MKRRTFLAASAAMTVLSKAQSTQSAEAPSASDSSNIFGEAGTIHNDILTGRNLRRSTVIGRHGMVASSQSLASSVGFGILKSGGNAIDAAIAVNAMLGLVEPMNCGVGGDLFAILWVEKEQRLFGLNASGRSPFAWNRDEANKQGYTKTLPLFGPHTWNVPGCVSGWQELQSRFGKLTFKEVLTPAMEYAREGFGMTEIVSTEWAGADTFKDYPNAAATFLRDGKKPQFGQIFRNPDLANTLEMLINGGAEAFYKGDIADRIVRYSKERGGYFSMSDFAEHNAQWVQPITTTYRGYNVWEIPPNGQGLAVLQILNILENFDIGSLKPNSAEHLHLFLEAKKLVFEDRSQYYADMAMADVPLTWLLSKEYAKKRAAQIDLKKANNEYKPGMMDGSSDTVYLCAADDEGNMISLIQSLYHGFGSREVPTGLGFAIQNRGRSFSLDPNHRNTLEPHKRPFHTIIPGFLTKDDKPVGPFGVMGGDFQPQGHSQVVMNRVDFGFSVQQAGEQPRAEHNGSTSPFGDEKLGGGTIGLEAGIGEDVKKQLEEWGHKVAKYGTERYGGYQAIWREENPRRYFAGSDPRKDGGAIGW